MVCSVLDVGSSGASDFILEIDVEVKEQKQSKRFQAVGRETSTGFRKAYIRRFWCSGNRLAFYTNDGEHPLRRGWEM